MKNASMAARIAGALIAGVAMAAAIPGVGRAGPLPRAFFGLGPASKTKIDGRPFFNWSATPGAHFTDHVAIVNFGATPVTLRVFVTNAVNTASGQTGFLPRGQSRGGPTDWITVRYPHNSSLMHLPPRTTVVLKITVTIPKNAPPGDHVGAVIAALTSVIRSKNHAKVHFVQQVADRIVARIAGKLHPSLSVVGLHVAYHDPINPLGTAPARLTFIVKNNGNALLGGKAYVSVQGTLGSTTTLAHPVVVPVLLPGGSAHLSATVNGVYPEFWMTANITIDPLVVTGQYDPGITNYVGQAGFFAIPWIPFGLFIIVAIGVVLTWWRRRRRRTAAASPPEAPRRELAEKRLGVLAPAILVVALAAGGSGPHLPFKDPDQAGWLTLCGTNLKPVVEGSITQAPFIWRVVSDTPAVKGYFVKGAKATMFAYQPRPDTPAGAWSGTVMGAASYYSSGAHPMAQFTPIDSPLTQMTVAYPPLWDHLIELRLYLSAPNAPTLTVRYAAADLAVTGKTWRLVAGGRASCTAGNAVSVEAVVGMPGARGQPKHPQLGTTGAGPGATSAPESLSRSSATGTVVIGVVIAALVAVAIAGGLWWRRRRAPVS